MLVQEKIGGSRPELPSQGQELNELKRRLERYGPRQQERGYMHLEADGQSYRLTWKGAILGAWRFHLADFRSAGLVDAKSKPSAAEVPGIRGISPDLDG